MGKLRRILIIEDEIILTQALSTYFSLKYAVDIANDGEAGLKMIQELQPDIVLLDIFLPKKNGFEILETVKADKKLKNIPIIILSNLGGKKDIEKGLSLGASDYLIKAETDLEDIVKKVDKILKKK